MTALVANGLPLIGLAAIGGGVFLMYRLGVRQIQSDIKMGQEDERLTMTAGTIRYESPDSGGVIGAGRSVIYGTHVIHGRDPNGSPWVDLYQATGAVRRFYGTRIPELIASDIVWLPNQQLASDRDQVLH